MVTIALSIRDSSFRPGGVRQFGICKLHYDTKQFANYCICIQFGIFFGSVGTEVSSPVADMRIARIDREHSCYCVP